MEVAIFIFCIINFALLTIVLVKMFKSSKNGNPNDDKRQADIIASIDDFKKKIENLDQRSLDENRHIIDEIGRQAERTAKQIENLSDRIVDSQEKQQNKINEVLSKIQLEMSELRTENGESLKEINSVVTEKMQKTLDDKFNSAFETVVKNMAEIGKTLNASLENQQKIITEKLEGLENGFERINNTVNEKLQKTLDEKLNGMSETVVKNMSELGKRLDESQDRQQKSTEAKLDKLADHFEKIRIAVVAQLENIRNSNLESMEKLRKDNQDSFDKINATVNEKLQKSLDEKLNGTSETVVRNMSELGKTLNESQERQQKSTEEKLEKLENTFSSTLKEIRTSNFESMEKLRRDNQESLDKINNTVNEKLQKTLDDKFSQSFETVNKRLAEVYEGLGEMKNVASGVSDLKNVLSNVKTRGIMGEIQLGAIIGDILTPDQYGEQVSVAPGNGERVDFAVKLPGMEDGDHVYLPIDAKFPGNTYANLIDAYNSGDSNELKEKRKNLEAEIKRCAKSIRDKYIVPPYTTGFAIMFLPFEGLYAEVVNMGLVESLQRDYKINIAGPSTMAAMLNSLQMGFRTLAIQKKSGEVWKILEAAKKEFSTFEGVLNQTRDRLRKADEDLDKLIGTRTRAINRKLSTVSALSSSEEAENVLAE